MSENLVHLKEISSRFIHSVSQSVIRSYLSESPFKELTHETGGEHMVDVHGSPHGRKVYIEWGVVWFPGGIV